MTGLGRKYCSNRCRDLTKYYGVVAVPENVGRQVTYRLVARRHYRASTEKLPLESPAQIISSAPQSAAAVEDQSIAREESRPHEDPLSNAGVHDSAQWVKDLFISQGLSTHTKSRNRIANVGQSQFSTTDVDNLS